MWLHQLFPQLASNPFCGSPCPKGSRKTLGARLDLCWREVLACNVSKSSNFVSCFSLDLLLPSGNNKSAISRYSI